MKRMYHHKNGWVWAENAVSEEHLRGLGWVEDRPEYSPKYVAPVAGPAVVSQPPEPSPTAEPGIQDKPKRGRPPKVSE